MNTNQITNKNLKRIAIAAGTTAAALFLSAGLVACGGNPTDNVAVPAQAAELTEVLENVVAEIAPTVEEVPTIEAEVAPVVETSTKSVAKPATKSTKTSKKKSSATGGAVVLNVPPISEAAPAVDSNATPTAQDPTLPQVDNTIISTPADQPAVEQPTAPEQASATEQAPASSGSTTAIKIPKIAIAPSLAAQLAGTSVDKLLAPSISVPCLPGLTC